MCRPVWLPDIICVDGDISVVIPLLYSVFYRDFKQSKPVFRSLTVRTDNRPEGFLNRTYEAGFLHLITNGPKSNRLFDNRRAEKLPWCRPVIENENEPEILVWDYMESDNKPNTYIWLKDYDYIVILREKNTSHHYYHLKTGFHISGDGIRKKLKNKYEKRVR